MCNLIGPISKSEFKYMGDLKKDIRFMLANSGLADFSRALPKEKEILQEKIRSFRPTGELAA